MGVSKSEAEAVRAILAQANQASEAAERGEISDPEALIVIGRLARTANGQLVFGSIGPTARQLVMDQLHQAAKEPAGRTRLTL